MSMDAIREEIERLKKLDKYHDQDAGGKVGGVVSSNIPAEYICPLTLEMFTDPVITVDGQCYERRAIEAWFQGHQTSPLSNAPLPSKHLIVNFALKKLIADFVEANKAK